MTGPVIIGENAWVAAEAFIGPGVTLGAGAVAGARAVVVRDVPPGAVVVGNPARLIASKEEQADAPVRMPSAQAR
jgi:putative colanic acid biosynthesis acetyltransferase WcaF